MHYLITSSNYDDFMSIKSQLDPVIDVDNISEICGNQNHPWHAWLTHKVATIMITETLLVISILLLSVFFSAMFNWSVLAIFAFFTVAALFSIWVSGLVGWHTIHLYSICQNLTANQDHPLALLVDSKGNNNIDVNNIVKLYRSSKITLIDD